MWQHIWSSENGCIPLLMDHALANLVIQLVLNTLWWLELTSFPHLPASLTSWRHSLQSSGQHTDTRTFSIVHNGVSADVGELSMLISCRWNPQQAQKFAATKFVINREFFLYNNGNCLQLSKVKMYNSYVQGICTFIPIYILFLTRV